MKDPVFISALDVANASSSVDTVKSGTIDYSNDKRIEVNEHQTNITNKSNNIEEKITTENPASQIVGKLRIVIPALPSPNSNNSSSSESNSPHRSKKHKKRFCIKCDLRFKHKADWLKHIEKHVSLPSVELVRLNENNPYMIRDENYSLKRCASEDHESLKITLKIPRKDLNSVVNKCETNEIRQPLQQNNESVNDNRSNERCQNATLQKKDTNCISDEPNEYRIRVLRAEEIKQSPPRIDSFESTPMVSIPMNEENINQYECPTFDGFSQIGNESENSTAELLKHLLESSTAQEPDTNNIDATTNEFIPIDQLAMKCHVCSEKFPDAHFLQTHQRITGHLSNGNISSTLSNRQQSTTLFETQIQKKQPQFISPQTNQLEAMLTRPRDPVHASRQPQNLYNQSRVGKLNVNI